MSDWSSAHQNTDLRLLLTWQNKEPARAQQLPLQIIHQSMSFPGKPIISLPSPSTPPTRKGGGKRKSWGSDLRPNEFAGWPDGDVKRGGGGGGGRFLGGKRAARRGGEGRIMRRGCCSGERWRLRWCDSAHLRQPDRRNHPHCQSGGVSSG